MNEFVTLTAIMEGGNHGSQITSLSEFYRMDQERQKRAFKSAAKFNVFVKPETNMERVKNELIELQSTESEELRENFDRLKLYKISN